MQPLIYRRDFEGQFGDPLRRVLQGTSRLQAALRVSGSDLRLVPRTLCMHVIVL